MCHVANDPAPNCNRMEKPPFTYPDTNPLSIVTKDKHLTNKHKVTWDEYHLQEATIFHRRDAIVAFVMPNTSKRKRWTSSGTAVKPSCCLLHTSTRGP